MNLNLFFSGLTFKRSRRTRQTRAIRLTYVRARETLCDHHHRTNREFQIYTRNNYFMCGEPLICVYERVMYHASMHILFLTQCGCIWCASAEQTTTTCRLLCVQRGVGVGAYMYAYNMMRSSVAGTVNYVGCLFYSCCGKLNEMKRFCIKWTYSDCIERTLLWIKTTKFPWGLAI